MFRGILALRGACRMAHPSYDLRAYEIFQLYFGWNSCMRMLLSKETSGSGRRMTFCRYATSSTLTVKFQFWVAGNLLVMLHLVVD